MSLFLGCANNSLVRFEAIAKRAASQDFLDAAAQVRKQRDLYNHTDLLYAMDLGLLYHYAGLYDSSAIFLREAVKIQEDLYAHSITNEAAALLVNDNIRPYRGKAYEITWLHLFLAFDYLGMNRYDDARVEIRQAEIFLREQRRKVGTDPKEYRDDGAFRTVAALVYEGLGEKDDALISLYQAVKAYRESGQPLPEGLARYAYAALMANGRESDAKELNLGPSVQDSRRPAFGGSEIVVVGEVGRSPMLDETAFWGTWVRDGMLIYHYKDANGNTVTDAMAAPGLPDSEYEKGNGRKTRSGTTFHVKWSMPTLRDVPSQSDALRVARGNDVYAGEAYGDTHDLLQGDLNAHRGITLLRTVTRVVLRTIAAEKTKSSLNTNEPLLNLLLNVGTDALADQLEQADLRVWFLLPRNLRMARVPVQPGRYTLEIGSEDRNGRTIRSETRDVEVKAGEKKFVFFTSLK